MTHVACESKLHSVLRSSMYPCPLSRVAIGRVFMYYARAARAFSAGIKCRHCIIHKPGSEETFNESNMILNCGYSHNWSQGRRKKMPHSENKKTLFDSSTCKSSKTRIANMKKSFIQYIKSIQLLPMHDLINLASIKSRSEILWV